MAIDSRNIVLTGMPGAGKSTVGVLLAKTLSRHFIDTDVVIQAQEGRSLRAIIEEEETAGFRAIEEQYVLGLDVLGYVIATGGSVVYGGDAMRHLADHGVVVYLQAELDVLQARLTDMATRGVLMAPGQSLSSLFSERDPLYRRYADLVLDVSHRSHGDVVADLVRRLVDTGDVQ